jgi:hypothetical protein
MERTKLVALLLAALFALAAAAPSFASPKFNPNSNQCSGPNDQPNCPGPQH